MRNSILSLVFLMLSATLCQAQEAAALRLQAVSLSEKTVATLSQRAREEQRWAEYSFNGETFVVIQFEALPTPAERAIWKAKGLRFLQFLPEKAYLIAIPSNVSPTDLPFSAVFPYLGTFKITRSCTAAINQRSGQGAIAVSILPMPGVSAKELLSTLPATFKVKQSKTSFIEGTLPITDIQTIAEHPGVWAIEAADMEPFPEGNQSGAIMGAPVLHSLNESAYTGEHTVIGIADDGNVFHTDLKNRLILDLSDDFGTSHGEMTTSIAAGAGNILPEAQGLAPGAKIHLSFILDYLHHESAVQNYAQHKVTITSTSYGDGCGGFYNMRAAALDAQINQHPQLIHCFSAGNQGGSTCSEVYALIDFDMATPFANITGGRKAAKNVITVGNVDTDGILAQSSSIGPAEDGRLKPDIVAVGQNALANGPGESYIQAGGTSASSPAIAGILALITEAYRSIHGGQDPPTDLIKAALLNGARDLGRPGPDFLHGWGLANADAAIEMIEAQQHFATKVAHEGEQTFEIQIPANTETAKIMLVWHDVAGAPVAERALVNDLDLRVIGPEGQLHHPLVLSSYPHPDSLSAVAAPGVDRLNNAEQVVIANPVPGTYIIKVKGHMVPEGPQPAHVVYRFESAGLQLQHPVAASIATPGEPLKVIWNKRDGGADFALSYRKAGTSSWTAIANNVSGHNWQYNWEVPVLLSGIYELRLSHGAETVISEPFVILGKPGFYIEPTGLNTAIVHWEAVEEATQYEVLALGEEYMESLGVTEGLSLPITIAQGSANWFSVQAKKGTANSGSRSRAQFYRQSVCNNEALLKLHLDDKPHETSWTLIDESGQQLIVAGPYPANMAGAILEIPLCLPDGCFTLSIQDSGNDGLCCEDGAGQYELYNGQGHLLAEGSHFGGSGTTFFCMESNQPTLQAFATGAATVSCHGATDGWAVAYTSGGTGVYSYQWSNGETSPEVENLSAGVHKVTISDQVTSVVSVVYIAEPAPLSAVIATEDSGCGSVGTGAVSAMVSGGTAPYQYIWSTGDTGQELQEVPVGVYGVTVYDNKGCTVSATAQVLDASPLALYMAGDNPTCADEPDGAVFVSVIGGYPPYQYEWSNGSIISSAFDLSAGSYQLTVTDAMGCSATGQVELISPEPMSTTITYSDSLSYMEVSVSGGVPPYTYQWSDGSTASVLTINESDIYLLTITDANGCEYTLSEEVPSEAPEHCTPEVSTNFYTWIEAVKLDTAMRYTGQNEAPYASFESVENQRFDVRAGQPYTMTLYPGFQGYTLPVYWRVWVDLNEDGDFDDEGEQRYHSGQQAADSIVLAFQLPPDVEPGLKTMRISQSFLAPPDPCGGYAYGEVEDYSLRVVGPVSYCTSSGLSTSHEWIEAVQIGTLENVSGNNLGYSDFSGLSFSAAAGASLPVALTPGYQSTPMVAHWSVWADFNRDGIFNYENELVIQSGASLGPVNTQFNIPVNTAPGPLSVRVQMRWNEILNPCGTISWGEVEDYLLMVESIADLRIDGDGPVAEQNKANVRSRSANLKAWPVPAKEMLNYAFALEKEEVVDVYLYNALGRLVKQVAHEGHNGLQQYRMDVAHLPPGMYQLVVQFRNETLLKNIVIQ